MLQPRSTLQYAVAIVTYLAGVQGDHMWVGIAEWWVAAQVGVHHIDSAENAGLLIGDAGGVQVIRVLRGEEVPPFPETQRRERVVGSGKLSLQLQSAQKKQQHINMKK